MFPNTSCIRQRPTRFHGEFDNTVDGHQKLIRKVAAESSALVVRESNRLQTCADADMAASIRSHLDHLQQLEDQRNQRIAETLQADPDRDQQRQAMTTLKGVADKTANTLLAHFPELGTRDRGQVAAIAGIAPHPQESGNWKGRRRIDGGRAAVRRAMDMAAKSAARWCPVIRAFDDRLRANGKSANQALIACAR